MGHSLTRPKFKLGVEMHLIFVLLEFKITKGKGSVCRAHT
jgi:hypothetical protein